MDNSSEYTTTDIQTGVKATSDMASFGRLPDDIILLILRLCDPNCFASLVLLNRNWRRVSQQAPLYAHQLSRCRSYVAAGHTIETPTTEDQLPLLRSIFAREIKRNLFEAYLRPRETTIKLVSTSISSSSAFPGGEAFHFSFSPHGVFVLAYSTSRIYVIRVAGGEIDVIRELKILRRPASVTILDDGSLLAVLSTDHQVDLYNLTKEHPVHIQAIALDHPPRTIALAPAGSVLAAAYDGGVEVYSLASTALPTDRRGVKCDAADCLSFSADGTQLLGTTLHSKNPSTVILTAPYFNPVEHAPEDSISQLWTTSILFPNSSRDCSHAVLLPSTLDDDTSWTFTYDRVFETFRAVRIDDLRNGTTYFTGPLSEETAVTKLLPSTLPAATGSGDMVAAGFQGNEIWLYGVPEDLEAVPDVGHGVSQTLDWDMGTPQSALSRANSNQSPRSHTWPKDASTSRIPQWKLLCDKSRNTFVQGRRVSSLEGISSLKWVSSTSDSLSGERLIAAAPGGVSQPNGLFEGDDEGTGPVDGGRLSILDFSYGISNGEKRELTIEVGGKEPETLEEEQRDLEAEVAIVRRRTVAQRRNDRTLVQRSATIATRMHPGVSQASSRLDGISSITTVPANPRTPLPPTAEQAEVASIDEDQESLDAPYAHGSPRSRSTLHRAATAAAVNRRLHPRIVAGQDRIEFRRADGREEHPHESDADNWVPPPPPYTKDAIAPLPEHLRNAIIAGVPNLASSLQRSATQRSNGSADADIFSSLHRSRTTFVPGGRMARYDTQHRTSFSTIRSSSEGSRENSRVPLGTHSYEAEDLYDVSPPRTPEPAVVSPTTPVAEYPQYPQYQIPRRPVANSGQPDVSPPAMANATLVETVSPIPQHPFMNSTGRPVSVVSLESEPAPDLGRVSPMEITGTSASSGSVVVTPNMAEANVVVQSNNYAMPSLPTTEWTGETGNQMDRVGYPTPNIAEPNLIAQSHNDYDMSSPPTGEWAVQAGNQMHQVGQPTPSMGEANLIAQSHNNYAMSSPPITQRAGQAGNRIDQLGPAQNISYPPQTTVTIPSGAPPPGQLASDLDLPSPAQLARLNSRSGRPSSRIIVDPSRRRSGSFTPPQVDSQTGSEDQVRNGQFVPPNVYVANQGTFTAPRAASGSYGPPMLSPILDSPVQTPLRRFSGGHGRHPSNSGNYRPRVSRLDTINSVASQGEVPYQAPLPVAPQTRPLGVSRQPSRAERSAAMNIQQAKKNGWRGMKKKNKNRDHDGASSAGWTDVSRDSFGKEKEKKGGKCIMM